MKKIMAVNAGSSSLKFQLLNMAMQEDFDAEVLIEGLFERIGLEHPILILKYQCRGELVKERKEVELADHGDAVKILVDVLLEKEIIKSLDEIDGVGHRVVHGGEKFKDSAIITDDVIAEIEELADLAPLHNPANLIGIRAFRKYLKDIVQIVVFDTSFHQTMPAESFMYAVPYEWYTKYGVRKYGFHGTSHKYVAMEASKYLGKPLEELRLVTAHIGNGASLAAIKYGICVDTSMGFTPLAGIPMGTRSGSIDPAIIEFIAKKENLRINEIMSILNKKSGYIGVYGESSDARDLRDAQMAGNKQADLIIEMQNKAIADYISCYYGYMGGIDAIIFTAGIGEKSPQTRSEVCERLREAYDIYIDEELNEIKGEFLDLSLPQSKIKILTIPTNEELMIAMDVMRLGYPK